MSHTIGIQGKAPWRPVYYQGFGQIATESRYAVALCQRDGFKRVQVVLRNESSGLHPMNSDEAMNEIVNRICRTELSGIEVGLIDFYLVWRHREDEGIQIPLVPTVPLRKIQSILKRAGLWPKHWRTWVHSSELIAGQTQVAIAFDRRIGMSPEQVQEVLSLCEPFVDDFSYGSVYQTQPRPDTPSADGMPDFRVAPAG